jgi:hypothetical protein
VLKRCREYALRNAAAGREDQPTARARGEPEAIRDSPLARISESLMVLMKCFLYIVHVSDICQLDLLRDLMVLIKQPTKFVDVSR